MDQNQKLLMSALVTEEVGKIKTAWSLAKVTRRNSIKKLASQTGVSIDLIDSFIDNDPRGDNLMNWQNRQIASILNARNCNIMTQSPSLCSTQNATKSCSPSIKSTSSLTNNTKTPITASSSFHFNSNPQLKSTSSITITPKNPNALKRGRSPNENISLNQALNFLNDSTLLDVKKIKTEKSSVSNENELICLSDDDDFSNDEMKTISQMDPSFNEEKLNNEFDKDGSSDKLNNEVDKDGSSDKLNNEVDEDGSSDKFNNEVDKLNNDEN